MISLNLGSTVLHVPNTDVCIPWPLHISSTGYGMKTDRSMRSRATTAHRWVYEKLVGDITEGAVATEMVNRQVTGAKCRGVRAGERFAYCPRLGPVSPGADGHSGIAATEGTTLLDGANVIVRRTGKRPPDVARQRDQQGIAKAVGGDVVAAAQGAGSCGDGVPQRRGGVVQPQVDVTLRRERREHLQPGPGEPAGAEDADPLREVEIDLLRAQLVV